MKQKFAKIRKNCHEIKDWKGILCPPEVVHNIQPQHSKDALKKLLCKRSSHNPTRNWAHLHENLVVRRKGTSFSRIEDKGWCRRLGPAKLFFHKQHKLLNMRRPRVIEGTVKHWWSKLIPLKYKSCWNGSEEMKYKCYKSGIREKQSNKYWQNEGKAWCTEDKHIDFSNFARQIIPGLYKVVN